MALKLVDVRGISTRHHLIDMLGFGKASQHQFLCKSNCSSTMLDLNDLSWQPKTEALLDIDANAYYASHIADAACTILQRKGLSISILHASFINV